MSFVERAARLGPQPFSAFMDWALYDEATGFYAGGDGAAGRRGGDFLTSPEVGPLFGAVLAGAVDGWWDAQGRPDPFVVVEAGAGPGTLARAVLAAEPRSAPALRYVLVEQSARQRQRHAEHLPLDPAAFAFGPEDDDSPMPQPADRGPIVVSLGELPRLAAPCVVVANELLDNLPFDLWERRDGRWQEVLVDADLQEVVVPLEPPGWLVAIDAAESARVPVQETARRWVLDALALARPDRRGPARRHRLRRHHRGSRGTAARFVASHLSRPSAGWPAARRARTQDITADVCLDQLPVPSTTSSQAGWLRAHGIDELIEEGRRGWEARAHVGDLAAVRMRSRVAEGEALLDEAGLGGFTVAEWAP